MLFATLVIEDYPHGYILSYFFSFLRVLSPSRMFVEYSLTCTFHHVWENFFNLQCSESSKTHLIKAFLLKPQSSSQNSKGNVLKICFLSPRRKGWRKLWFALSKFNQKIWRWLGTLVYLYFVWFVIFLNVMTLQFCG